MCHFTNLQKRNSTIETTALGPIVASKQTLAVRPLF